MEAANEGRRRQSIHVNPFQIPTPPGQNIASSAEKSAKLVEPLQMLH